LAALQRVGDEVPFEGLDAGLEQAALDEFARFRHLERRRQVVAVDDAVGGQEHRVLDAVLQLADVSRPVIREEHVDRRGADPPHLFAHVGRVLGHEMVGQQEDVVFALPQRRQEDGEDVDPVEEIEPEGLVLDQRFQVPVRGGDHADVRGQGLVAADPLALAFLQDPQEFDLDGGREVADLVEEEGPAFRFPSPR